MKSILSLCALATVSSLLLVSNAMAGSHAADVKALTETEIHWNQDLASKDGAKIASYYAEDGVLMVTGQKAFVGRPTIQAAFTAMVSDPAFALKFQTQTLYVSKSGDVAYTHGPYTLDFTDPATKQVVHDHGSYVTTYRKAANGSWKATEDVAVSEVPR